MGPDYEGERKDGKPHGKGTIKYTDGSVLEGTWVDGKLEGFGRKLFKNGDVCYVGEFKNDVFNGRGVLYNEHASKGQDVKPLDHTDLTSISQLWTNYEGEFENNKKHGNGTLLFVTNEKFEGTFNHDKISGKGTFSTDSGKEIEGIWKDGLLQKESDTASKE